MKRQQDYELILTAFPKFFSKDKKSVLLERYCMRYDLIEEYCEGQYELFPEIWRTNEEKKEAREYCENFAKRLLPALAKALNSFHQESHSDRYWSFILLPWLKVYFEYLYFFYMTLQHVLEKHPRIRVHVLEVNAKENLGINKYPLMDLRINAIVKEDERDDYFFLFVFSKILKRLEYQNVITHFVELPKMNEEEHYQISVDNRGLKGKLKLFYERLNRNPRVLYVNNYLEDAVKPIRKQLITKVTFIESPTKWLQGGRTAICKEQREQLLIDFKTQNKFEEFVLQYIRYDIPVEMVESYQELVVFRKREMVWNPKCIIWGGNELTDYKEGVFWGELYEKGTEVRYSAHTPAESMINYSLNVWIDLADKFYVFGKTENEKLIQAPMFKGYWHGSKEVRGNSKDAKNILWAMLGKERYAGKLYWNAFTETEDYFVDIFEFAKGIRNDLHDVLVLRERAEVSWKQTHEICKVIPNLQLDRQCDFVGVGSGFYEMAVESRIVVCEDIFSSVLWECIAHNIPVIVFCRDNFADLHDGTKVYLDLLKKNGIWYETGCEAAEFLNCNYDRIDEWWREDERREACRRCVAHFFLMADSVSEWWKNELSSIG